MKQACTTPLPGHRLEFRLQSLIPPCFRLSHLQSHMPPCFRLSLLRHGRTTMQTAPLHPANGHYKDKHNEKMGCFPWLHATDPLSYRNTCIMHRLSCSAHALGGYQEVKACRCEAKQLIEPVSETVTHSRQILRARFHLPQSLSSKPAGHPAAVRLRLTSLSKCNATAGSTREDE